eukprot:c20028_g1_i1 orf=372-1973(+)
MVTSNTQASPLQHHSKSSNALKSFKNYSRIQSEVQKEGFEVHKENLLSLSLSKKDEHFGAGEKHDPSAPLRLQVGHLCTHGAPAKTGLPNVFSAEMVTSSHGHIMRQHENDIYSELGVSHDRRRLLEPGAAEKLSSRAAFSNTACLSPAPGEEANNAFKLYSEMFPRGFTSASACTAISSMDEEQEFCPPKPMMAENVEVVQFLPDAVLARNVEDQADNVKRLKYTSIMEDMSIRQTSEQGIPSSCVVNASSMCAARAVAGHTSMGDICSFNCVSTTKDCTVTMTTSQHPANGFNAGFSLEESNASRVCSVNMYSTCRTSLTAEFSKAPSAINVYSACSTSLTAELSRAPPAIGLKLFTTSAHAQMPKALLTFSEGEPSLPLSLEHTQQQASTKMQKTPMHEDSCTDADWGKFLALSATPVASNANTSSARVLPFQQRFKQLQAFLKQCDEADQNECMLALRSLSAAARSGHAVELETRAIRLSLEEGKEMKRMRLLNVLGKISEQSFDDAGATPQGPRLPAPGAIPKFKGVP